MSRQVGKFWWTFFGGKFLISLKTNSYSWLNFQILCIFCIFSNSLLNFQTSSLGRLLRHNQTISRLSLQWNCIGLDQVRELDTNDVDDHHNRHHHHHHHHHYHYRHYHGFHFLTTAIITIVHYIVIFLFCFACPFWTKLFAFNYCPYSYFLSLSSSYFFFFPIWYWYRCIYDQSMTI